MIHDTCIITFEGSLSMLHLLSSLWNTQLSPAGPLPATSTTVGQRELKSWLQMVMIGQLRTAKLHNELVEMCTIAGERDFVTSDHHKLSHLPREQLDIPDWQPVFTYLHSLISIDIQHRIVRFIREDWAVLVQFHTGVCKDLKNLYCQTPRRTIVIDISSNIRLGIHWWIVIWIGWACCPHACYIKLIY